jgi:hypothetical protein
MIRVLKWKQNALIIYINLSIYSKIIYIRGKKK